MTRLAPDAADPWQEALAAARAALDAGQQRLRARYEARPVTTTLLTGRARLVDRILQDLFQRCALADCALVAVGGYGRGELFPASDVDLLILAPSPNCTPAVTEKIAAFSAALWDIGLQVGQSVRTPQMCCEAARADLSVQTSLLEARFLAGDASLFAQFERLHRAGLSVADFYAAKLAEQKRRYARHDNTPYALEPNCKEGPGGLRDLHLLGWIARAANLGSHWKDLAHRRLITGDEAIALRGIERFLQHIRIRLHYLARRGEDRVLFDYQETLARLLGIRESTTRRASEILMQRYYLAARKLSHLSAVLLQNYQSELLSQGSIESRQLNARFQAQGDLLDMRDERLFARQPEAMLEAFALLQENPQLRDMSARTLRALWRERRRINAAFRAADSNRRLFLRLFQAPQAVHQTFVRLNQYDILSQYLPAWRRIVGQMQHDLFHAYTVDQHILTALGNLQRFILPAQRDEFPLPASLAADFERYWLLYIAALFHDIAKGRGGDHSLQGMADARTFCQNHGLAPEDVELVVWLVEHHLRLSRVAQKEDISDPAVIARLAKVLGSERRLVALYLLTHADIRATSPKLWNSWRARLLEDLFAAVRRVLRGEDSSTAGSIKMRLQAAGDFLRPQHIDADRQEALWQQFDELYFLRHSAAEIAWHTQVLLHAAESENPVVQARFDRGNLQIMVYTHDQRELFLRLTGYLGQLGLSVLEAKIHTTKKGYALDSFVMSEVYGSTVLPGEDATTVAATLARRLGAFLRDNAPLVEPQDRLISRQARYFPIQPALELAPADDGRHHVLNVVASDRPGLLFRLARVFADYRINLQTARISTLGARVEDTFVVSGESLAQDIVANGLQQALLEALQ